MGDEENACYRRKDIAVHFLFIVQRQTKESEQSVNEKLVCVPNNHDSGLSGPAEMPKICIQLNEIKRRKKETHKNIGKLLLQVRVRASN